MLPASQHGNGIYHHDPAGSSVTRQPLSHMQTEQFSSRRVGRIFRHHDRYDHFAPFAVGQAQDRRIPDARAGLQGRRDLTGDHLVPAGIDHVVRAPAHDHPAPTDPPAHVAGPEPLRRPGAAGPPR